MGVALAGGLVVVWVALMVAAAVWALRARRHAREEHALEAAHAAAPATVDLTDAAPVELAPEVAVDVTDPAALPLQREA